MIKAYEDHKLGWNEPYGATHRQQAAAIWFQLYRDEIEKGCVYPDQILEDAEVCASKYARARYMMGLREADYNV